jgi:hypothetical protein
MKVKTQLGFWEAIELKRVLNSSNLPIDTMNIRDMDEIIKATVSKEDFPIMIQDSIPLNPLTFATFSEKGMESGKWKSPLENGKVWVYGRFFKENTPAELYYLSVKPNEKRLDTRFTGLAVPDSISRIHCYARDLGKEIEFARLGRNPISIKVSDSYESNIMI